MFFEVGGQGGTFRSKCLSQMQMSSVKLTAPLRVACLSLSSANREASSCLAQILLSTHIFLATSVSLNCSFTIVAFFPPDTGLLVENVSTDGELLSIPLKLARYSLHGRITPFMLHHGRVLITRDPGLPVDNEDKQRGTARLQTCTVETHGCHLANVYYNCIRAGNNK